LNLQKYLYEPDNSFSTATRHGLHGPASDSLWGKTFVSYPEGPWVPPKFPLEHSGCQSGKGSEEQPRTPTPIECGC